MDIKKKHILFISLLLLSVHGCGGRDILVFSDSSSEAESTDVSNEHDLNDPSGEEPCLDDEDCQNGLVCDGRERCLEGRCMPGDPLDCDDGRGCTVDYCDEEQGGCVHEIRDGDGDGFGDEACGGTDCDDTRADVYPGAPGSCTEGEDRNCTGTPDLDDDSDGYIDDQCPGGDDCDDSNRAAYPGAPEICLDGIDQDCDGLVDGPMAMMPSMQIRGITGSHITLAMEWTGRMFALAWNGIYFKRISSEGDEIGEETILTDYDCLGQPPGSCYFGAPPDMVWTGDEFIVVFVGYWPYYRSELDLLRVDENGEVIGNDMPISIDVECGNESLAWTGSFLGLGGGLYIDGEKSVLFTTISTLGEELSEAEILSTEKAESPRVAWTESEFGVVWRQGPEYDGKDIYFARFNADGDKIGENIPVTSDGIYWGVYAVSDLVWSGSEFALSWSQDDGYTDEHIYFSRISADGSEISETTLVSNAEIASSSYSPVLSWSGSNYGIAWADNREDQACSNCHYRLYFSCLNSAGERLGEELCLGGSSSSWGSRCIAISWTGSEFGIAWICYNLEGIDCESGMYFNRIGFCD